MGLKLPPLDDDDGELLPPDVVNLKVRATAMPVETTGWKPGDQQKLEAHMKAWSDTQGLKRFCTHTNEG